MLYRLGIHTSPIKSVVEKGYIPEKLQHTLQVRKISEIKKLAKLPFLHDNKRKIIEDYLSTRKVRCCEYVLVPKSILAEFNSLCKGRLRELDRKYGCLRTMYSAAYTKGWMVGLDSINHLRAGLIKENLSVGPITQKYFNLLDSGLGFARVKSISELLEQDVVDINVPAAENFFANGFLVHNSGQKSVRKEASKGSFADVDVRTVVKQVEDADIDVIANFIVGLEGDTYESMCITESLALELNTRMMNVYPAMSLPGTPLYEKAKKEGKKLPDSYEAFGFLSYDCQPLGTDTLTPAEVLKFRDEMFVDYWSRPEFHKKVEQKFGSVAVENIKEMLKVKLKRKLLGD